MRYLGMDFGTKRVGLALSDEAGRMGFPHAVVPNDGRLLDYVRELITRKNVDVLVVGDSRDFSGNPNPMMAKAKDFIRTLERTSDVEVVWEPETMTSQEARRDIDGVYTKSHIGVDSSAAAIILSSYLSRINPPMAIDPDADTIDPYDGK